jgi:O-antigen ligase
MIPASRDFWAADRLSEARWALLGFAAAIALGSTAAFNDGTALALAVLIALISAIAIQPTTSIVFLLTISVFLESVKLGGITISRVVAPFALTIVVIEAFRGGAKIRANSTLLWVVVYSVWVLASGLWSASLGGTGSFVASLAIGLIYMLAIAAFVHSPRELRRFLFIAAAAAFVIGFVSIAAFLHLFTVTSAVLQAGRAQGGNGDPNYFASLQLIVLPFAMVLVPEGRKLWHRCLLCFAALVIIGSVLASTSRGGILGLITVSLLIALLPSRSLFESRRQKALVMAALAIGTALCFALPTLRNGVTSRVSTIFQTNEVSGSSAGSGRTDVWRAAERGLSHHPVLGLGAGNFERVSDDLMLDTPGVDLTTYELRPSGTPVHNTFLGTATELGIPGLALLLGLLISAAVSLRRIAVGARRSGLSLVQRAANAALVSLGGWAVTAFFLETETSRPIWVLIGLSLALPKLVSGERFESRSAGREPS